MNLSESAQQSLSRLIGAGVEKSSEKLAKISQTQWNMQTVSVKMGPGQQMRSVMSDDTQDYWGLNFFMPGGAAMVLFSTVSSKVVVAAYLGERLSRMKTVQHSEENVLAEVSNVIVNSVAAALADASGLNFLVTPGRITRGTKRRLYDAMLSEFPSAQGNLAVTSYAHMSSASLSVGCSMVLLINDEMTDYVVKALK